MCTLLETVVLHELLHLLLRVCANRYHVSCQAVDSVAAAALRDSLAN